MYGSIAHGDFSILMPFSCRAGWLEEECRNQSAGIFLLQTAQGSCRLWGRYSPSSDSCHQPAWPLVTISSVFHFVSRGTFQVTFVVGETQGCFTSQCNFQRPRMAHNLPSHIPWGMCVCLLSLPFSESCFD